ncbi:MAG TPA: HD domain-containing phosphohydrolase [Candidatus Angelobacter sp.]
MAELPIRARLFLFFMWTAGALCFATGMLPWHSSNGLMFISYLALTALASALKTVLPGLEGTVSVNDVFFLVGVCSMTLSETLALSAVASVVQTFWRTRKRLGIIHFAFNLSQIAVAITAAYWTYAFFFNRVFHGKPPLALCLAAVVYSLLNSISVATVVALAGGTSIRKEWLTAYWTFPYYMVGTAIAGVIQLLNRVAGWEMSILVLPALYTVVRSYRLQADRWEDERIHLEEIASLHVRTIETLALAIEAKDHTTGDHLQRVRVYASELAKDLGLSALESEALQAASVLHDIGKLAVPEHIISKPGKLTPEEFDKMKIHPIVGAEILEQVRFPYPVADIVHSHHEKWDGSGYPDGLAGDTIPIGARILSAVDCLDALASDRQYRRALPLDEAMAHVERESGKAFDPRVVAALKNRYVELEQLARSQEPQERPTLSVDVKVSRGAAPDAGFAVPSTPPAEFSTLNHNESHDTFDMFSSRPDEALNFNETVSAAAVRLRHLIPFDAIAVFVLSNDVLIPNFILGENMRQLSALRVPSGEGLVGWVAETGNSIVNGNPTVEPGYTRQMQASVVLRSALAVPLQDGGRVVGVLALYRLEPEAFTSVHLGFLQNSRRHLGAAIAQHLGMQSIPVADSLHEVALGPHLVGATRTPRPF